MIKLLYILTSLFASDIELKHLSLEYEYAVGTNRPPYFFEGYGRKVGELNLNMRTEIDNIYSIIRVESIIAERQFSNVALDTELGIKWERFDFYTQHRSEHILDQTMPQKYPNENSVGVRVNLK